jgi:outer membrane lipoprotein SlyB
MNILRKAVKTKILTVVVCALASGCATQQDLSRHSASTYDPSQLNKVQNVKTVDLISVLPARVAVDNSANAKRNAETAALIGALAGAALGANANTSNARKRGATTAVGGAVGAGVGAAVGSATPTVIYEEGVSLTYMFEGKPLSSTQIGKQCEFKPGPAVMVSTEGKANETRIQPNAVCAGASK